MAQAGQSDQEWGGMGRHGTASLGLTTEGPAEGPEERGSVQYSTMATVIVCIFWTCLEKLVFSWSILLSVCHLCVFRFIHLSFNLSE